MGKYEDLKNLDELRQRGAVSDAEYQREKEKILNASNSKQLFGLDEKTFLMLMHLSQFAGIIIAGLGFIAPIAMWLLNKGNQNVDKHGRNIANFMISMIIYYAIAVILCIILIGIPILIILAVLQIVFIIIASIKAWNGEYWKYPLSFNIL